MHRNKVNNVGICNQCFSFRRKRRRDNQSGGQGAQYYNKYISKGEREKGGGERKRKRKRERKRERETQTQRENWDRKRAGVFTSVYGDVSECTLLRRSRLTHKQTYIPEGDSCWVECWTVIIITVIANTICMVTRTETETKSLILFTPEIPWWSYFDDHIALDECCAIQILCKSHLIRGQLLLEFVDFDMFSSPRDQLIEPIVHRQADRQTDRHARAHKHTDAYTHSAWARTHTHIQTQKEKLRHVWKKSMVKKKLFYCFTDPFFFFWNIDWTLYPPVQTKALILIFELIKSKPQVRTKLC